MIGTNFGIYRPISSGSTSNPAEVGRGATVGAKINIKPEERAQHAQQISDFMLQLEDYVPTVPDAVTSHFLNTAGFESSDPRIVRLISIATQKFISDVANDALQHCKTRTNNHHSVKNPKPVKDRKYTLTMDDMAPALTDYGITVRKAQYFP